MQSEFSPPSLTRLDAVLWFLRIELWLSVIALVQGLFVPFGFFIGGLLQNLVAYGVPILVLALFPRVLASAMLGGNAAASLSSFHDFRPLVWRCVGVALFTGALGRAVIASFAIVSTLITRQTPAWGSVTSQVFVFQIVTSAFAIILGFFLAFGPSIGDNFRAR